MANATEKAVILIPSLEPDDRLPAYIENLHASGFERFVIIDDGSSEKYQPIFEKIDAMPGCTVLHHEVNRGKGAALKTGYKWIEENCPDITGVITADADGQHTVPDCVKMAEALTKGERALYLGSRDFSLPHVPPKSRFGNRTTTLVFWMLYGQWLCDTQTGLRAFRKEELGFMQQIEGERFEYEMNVLIACAREKIPMPAITIETVYENDNAGTHFNPIRDSIRIYKVLLGQYLRFVGVSIASFLLDNGLTWLLNDLLLASVMPDQAFRLSVCNLIARVGSSVFNFTMNKQLIFKLKGNTGKAAVKYFALCLVILGLSVCGQLLLSFVGIDVHIGKPICDTLLSLLSYRIQHRWVFKEENA